MSKMVIVEADTNDGDLISDETSLSQGKIDELKAIIAKLNPDSHPYSISWGKGDQREPGNDPNILYGSVLTEEEIEFIDDLIPYHEYGTHSIDSIKVVELIEKIY